MIQYLISLFDKYIKPIYAKEPKKLHDSDMIDIESQLLDNNSCNNKVYYLEGNPIYLDDESSSLASNNYER